MVGMDEFKTETCSITGDDCFFSNCANCPVEKESREEGIEQKKQEVLTFNRRVEYYGERFTINIHNTMGVTIPETYKRMCENGLAGAKYTWGDYVKNQYPHFVMLMERIGLEPPGEVIKCRDNVGVFVYDDFIYISAWHEPDQRCQNE